MNDQALIERARRALLSAGVATPPDYAPTRLKVDVLTVPSAQQACALIDAFAPSSGWAQHCSAVRLWQGGWRADDGPLLAGEFVRDHKASLHVRHGAAGWTLVTLTEGEGEPVVVRSHRFESVAALNGAAVPGHSLRYRVYLRRLPDIGLRPMQARFIGFGEE